MDRRGMPAHAVVVFEMPGDGVRTRIKTLHDQLLSQRADQRDNSRVGRCR